MATKEELWLTDQLKENNVPDPSVRQPKGDRELWTKHTQWALLSRGKKFSYVKHECVTLRREDIVSKACQQISVVKAEIACPIDPVKGWDEWTAPIKAARRSISIVRNRLTQLLIANDGAPDLFGKDVKLSYSQLNCYKRVKLIQQELSERAAEEVQKLEEQEKELAAKAEKSRGKTKVATTNKLKEVRKKLNSKKADAALRFSSSTQSDIANATLQAYKDWASKKGDKDVPSMRPRQPIPLRAGSGSPEWDVEKSQKGYKVRFRICSNTGWQYGALRVSSGKDHATIQSYLKGRATRRNGKLFYDERRKKWIVAMTFGVPRAVPSEEKGVAAIRIGVQDFIFLLDDQGRTRDLETYHKSSHEIGSRDSFTKRHKIIPRKFEFNELNRAARKDRNFQGRGARGHGKKRFNRTYSRHRDSESRFVKTWMGQVAAAAVKHCRTHGIGKVYIAQMTTVVPKYILDNYMDERLSWLIKRFPFCTLRDAVIRSLDKAGVEVIVTSDDRDCDTCPACGHVDKMNHNPKRRLFWCTECGTRLEADLAAGWNYLQKNGIDCSGIKRISDYKQEWHKEMDQKAMNIAQQDIDFEQAHNPEAAE